MKKILIPKHRVSYIDYEEIYPVKPGNYTEEELIGYNRAFKKDGLWYVKATVRLSTEVDYTKSWVYESNEEALEKYNDLQKAYADALPYIEIEK